MRDLALTQFATARAKESKHCKCNKIIVIRLRMGFVQIVMGGVRIFLPIISTAFLYEYSDASVDLSKGNMRRGFLSIN